MKRRKLTPRTRTLALTLGGFALLALLLLLGGLRGSRSLAAERVSTTGERVAFLKDCGWEVDPASETEQTIHIPERFGEVFERYNELQRQQGWDLSELRGKDCTLYTYAVTNGPEEDAPVLANLYVYRDRVVGGDVHSTRLDGFMVGLR